MKNLVKSILIISILLFIICGVQTVYAVSNCKIGLEPDKREYTKGDEIIVSVRIYNIQSELGINSVGMTLEYNKDRLELKEMQGENGWETPVNGASYNANNGKIAISKSGLAKQDENILKLKFIAKENTNATVALKNITASDTTLIKMEDVSKEITIKEKTIIPGDNNGNNNTSNSGTNNGSNNNNSGVNNNQNNNNTSGTNNTQNSNNGNIIEITTPNKLPKTGDANIILTGTIAISIALMGIYFIKIKK